MWCRNNTYFENISDSFGSNARRMLDLAESMFKQSIALMTDILRKAMNDNSAYGQLINFECPVPFIREGLIINAFREFAPFYANALEKFDGESQIMHLRDCKEFGIKLINCYRHVTGLLVNGGDPVIITPYVGLYSHQITINNIKKCFLDNEIGKVKEDIEKRYVCNQKDISFKGLNLIPVYDSENRLASVKSYS